MPSSAPCLRAKAIFFFRRCAGDHPRAHQLAELDRRQTCAARGAKYGKGFSGLEPGAVFQRVQRGAVGNAEAGGAVNVEAIGNLDEPAGRDRNAFARGAVARVTHDAVTDHELCDARAETLDRAGKLCGRRKWQRRFSLVFVGNDQRVEKVKCGCLDLHGYFARPGNRIRNICERQVVRRAVAGAEQGFHGDRAGGIVQRE